MSERMIGIIMNGVTGRMGTNQHLIRSILAIRDQGGVQIGHDTTLLPDPMLLGRNRAKLHRLAQSHGLTRVSTDIDEALADPYNQVYFDSQLTTLRVAAVRKAIAARKAIYCEKPTADSAADAMSLFREAKAAGLKNGVVQDKLWLPGPLKLKHLADSDYFGKILSVRGEFGYWVFDGYNQPTQRPSWNYRKEDGGGIILDMFPHWHYIIENLFGAIKAVSCLGATHVAKRQDEDGNGYRCTAEDAAYATFELENGIICQFNSSWAVRVRRDDLLTIQVDGSRGSAVATLRECYVQHDSVTPKPVWNPDIPNAIDFFGTWQAMPNNQVYDNAFKVQWELFLKHVAIDTPFPWSLLDGAKGVQLAELAMQSWAQRRWVQVPALVDEH